MHIKQLSIHLFFDIHILWNKIPVGGLYTSLFHVIIPPLFLYFLPFCYPYILLHFKCSFSGKLVYPQPGLHP